MVIVVMKKQEVSLCLLLNMWNQITRIYVQYNEGYWEHFRGSKRFQREFSAWFKDYIDINPTFLDYILPYFQYLYSCTFFKVIKYYYIVHRILLLKVSNV